MSEYRQSFRCNSWTSLVSWCLAMTGSHARYVKSRKAASTKQAGSVYGTLKFPDFVIKKFAQVISWAALPTEASADIYCSCVLNRNFGQGIIVIHKAPVIITPLTSAWCLFSIVIRLWHSQKSDFKHFFTGRHQGVHFRDIT